MAQLLFKQPLKARRATNTRSFLIALMCHKLKDERLIQLWFDLVVLMSCAGPLFPLACYVRTAETPKAPKQTMDLFDDHGVHMPIHHRPQRGIRKGGYGKRITFE